MKIYNEDNLNVIKRVKTSTGRVISIYKEKMSDEVEKSEVFNKEGAEIMITYQVNNNGIIPSFVNYSSPYLISDADFYEISEYEVSRKLLLKSLGADSIIVSRIGVPFKDKEFVTFDDEVKPKLIGGWYLMIIYDYLKNANEIKPDYEETKYFFALQKAGELNSINLTKCLGMLKYLVDKDNLDDEEKDYFRKLCVIISRILKVDCKILLRRLNNGH